MDKKDLRIIFMGTPEFAVGSLKKLIENGYNVVAVVTQPDKPVGRHHDTLHPSAVKEFATEHGIPVLQPVKMKDQGFVEELQSYHADLQIVVAFRMLPEVVWAMPRFGTFNVHAALLPQYRGAAPINWAVINGETLTGVTTFFLDRDIDTGRIIQKKEFPIPDDADAAYVYDGLMRLGSELCIETVDRVIATDGNVPSIPQPDMGGNLKLAPKIFKETCEIDWHQRAKNIYDFVRGLSPVPAAWTTLVNDVNGKSIGLKIYRTVKTDLPCTAEAGILQVDKAHLYVATADNWLEITEIQPAGKKRMTAKDFLNGMHDIENYTAK
ncbi:MULTISPECIES: methionyl-tRNA formyltransferase [Prevotellaceae]|uniref:methionyl-tRNA formyltransferase n=1 Tax=Prevotellaceae TaxID=171552 RepID=UPI0003D3AA43|nr:methionyl-tRNA formyltransferase [Prevotella phocaeensis]ETD21730.1 methionyl-tRNA formyltransferase [Hoylesella oralis CC98A]